MFQELEIILVAILLMISLNSTELWIRRLGIVLTGIGLFIALL